MILGATYVAGAVAMLFIGVVLLIRRGRSEAARNVALAAFVSAAWAGVMVSQTAAESWPTWNAIMADGFRFGAWLIALLSLASAEVPPWLRRASLGLCGLLIIYTALGGISQSAEGVKPLPLDSILGLVTAVAALATTLHVWRHADGGGVSREVRWSAAAIAGQFAVDALTYAQSQWQGDVHASLALLRLLTVCVALVPATIGVWRMPVQVPRLFISRQVVFFTSSVVVLLGYMVVTVLAAYVARRFGGSIGPFLQTAVIGAAALLLIFFLIADWPSRRLRVFISTHFYRNKYDYRIEWLRFVQTLSTGEEPDVRRNSIRAVAQIFDSPSGLLLLREQAGGPYYLQCAWPERSSEFPQVTPVAGNDDLPRFLMDKQWVVDLREYADRPQHYGNLKLPGWLDPAGPWRIVAPLLVGNQLQGFLVLRAPPDPFEITFEDLDLLKTAGRNVAVQLAQRSADEQLALSRQFDAYNRFAAFVMHDLKNSVAQLRLLVANAAKHRSNPVFVDDAIDTIRNTSERMTRLIEQLQRRDMQGASRNMELAPVVAAAVARSQSREPAVSVEGTLDSATVMADPERLASILEHVIRNAQDATATLGTVTLQLRANGGEAELTVIDDGAGMDEEFVRNRLFRPFDSTKGSKGMGIGAYQVREYARTLGGDVDVWSAPGRGTRFCIRLPLCPKKNPHS